MPKSKHPWDVASRLPLTRGNGDYRPGGLEDGVKFFVIRLEQLGCRTEWSCEGHPDGFHVVFHGPERVAREIVAAGVFAVGLWEHGGWVITIKAEEIANERRQPWTERQRRKDLRLAADFWIDHFGDLDEDYPESLVVEPRDRSMETFRQLVIAADAFLADKDNIDEELGLSCAVEDAYKALAVDPQYLPD